MDIIHQIGNAGFKIELLPNNNLGLGPNMLNQHQRNYITSNKGDTAKYLQTRMISAWLSRIGETEGDHYLILNKCRHNPGTMSYFLKHARDEFASETNLLVKIGEQQQ